MLYQIAQVTYPMLLLMSSTKKNFSQLGRIVKRSSDTIRRMLFTADESFTEIAYMATRFFKNKKHLHIIIDDTLVTKMYSRWMEGSAWFYHTLFCRSFMAYKLLCLAVSDGKYTFPLKAAFVYSQQLSDQPVLTREDLVKQLIAYAQHLFPDTKLTFVLDGAFTTKSLLKWANERKLRLELRMHSNRKVVYKGQSIVLKHIRALRPKGRQKYRTISVTWYDNQLYVTAHLRQNDSLVFLVATYKARPAQHIATYDKRWPIEKFFRTAKQHLGLKDCASTKEEQQYNHVASVCFAYALTQLDMKQRKFKTPEQAIRSYKQRKVKNVIARISLLYQNFKIAYA